MRKIIKLIAALQACGLIIEVDWHWNETDVMIKILNAASEDYQYIFLTGDGMPYCE